MSEKKMVRRSVAIAFGARARCVILVASLVGAFAYYMPTINNKNDTITSLNSCVSQLNYSVTNLQSQTNQLQANLDGNVTLLNQTQGWLERNITYYSSQIESLNSEINILNNTLSQLTSFPKIGQNMIYEQFFEWTSHNEITFMTWNITGLEGNLANLHLVSYDVNVNTSDNNAVVSAVDENWTIDVSNREIVNSTDASIISLKCPFWIEKNVHVGSMIDTLYGQTTIIRSDTISVLGEQRDCWVVEYDWPTSSMVRWYDKSTGIVIMTHVVRQQQSTKIQSIETATQTNIVLLQ